MDIQIFKTIHLGWNNPAMDVLNLILSWSGLGVMVAAIAIGMLFHPKTKPFGVPILLSVTLGGLVFAHSFKTLMPRPRPSNLSFSKPQESHKQSSFPSAHTATAFAAATACVLTARRRKLASLSLFWAAGVGISRIYRGVHWPSDVLAGACLGVLAACLVHLYLTSSTKVRKTETYDN